MIYISERQPEKLPGLSSLFVTFDFNMEIVNVLRSVESAIYHKKTKTWECPITSLATLIDSLTSLDEIKLLLMQDSAPNVQDVTLYNNYKTQPFQYQLDGIKYGCSHNNWLLLDAPGLGKTLQILYIAQELRARENLDHCLIICGINTLKMNWKKEVEKHTDLSCKILGERINKSGKLRIGGVKERAEDLSENLNEFFIITNIETLRNDDVVELIEHGPNKFDMIVVDEIHTCKSPTSIQGKHLLKLKSAKHKIGLTGTVLLNDPLDLYVPLKWTNIDHSTYTNFKNYYCNFGGPFRNMLINFKHTDVLKDQLEKFSLRRTKELLELPEKTVIDEYIELNSGHDKFYNDIKKGIIDNIDKVKIDTTSLLTMVTRLRQATACPSILSTTDVVSSKIERAEDLIEQILSSDEKVVVFSTFKESVNLLNKKYTDCSVLCTGDINDVDIAKNIDKFQTDDSCKIMLATWQKMGTGVTLTAARYMIFLDTPWTYGVYEQAQDRIHRIGSKNSVFIYNLICKDTIDERVAEIVSSKQAMSDYIVDDKMTTASIDILRKYIEDLI